MSRQSVVTDPAVPGKCIICARSSNGVVKFIDFNFSMDYYGAVVICEDCIKESLTLLDHVPRNQLVAAIENMQILEQLLETSNADLDSYRSIIDSIGVIRPDLSDSLKTPKQADVSNDKSNKSASTTESESDESDSSGGPENVSESGNPNLFG